MLMNSETRSIAIDAAPGAVHAYVADARNFPEWAPAFASAVRPDGDTWIVTSGDAELEIAVVADAAAGTVDIVAAANHALGAFSRVLPNGDGSEFQFTLFFADGTPDAAVAAQMATVEQELQAVRAAVGG